MPQPLESQWKSNFKALWFDELDFDEKQTEYDYRKIKLFIHKVLAEEKKRIGKELLEKGHGGGNWRRLIMKITNQE